MEFLPFNILGAAPYISDLCLAINRQLTYKKDLTISYLIWIYQMFELKERQKYQRYIYCFMKISYCCCSVAKWCLTLCDPMKCGIPGFPVLHYLPGFAQTHIHWVIDAIQPSHPLAPLFLLKVAQHQGLSMSQPFTSGGKSIRASASVLQMNIQGWFSLGLTALILLQSKGLTRVFSNTSVQKHQFFGT